MCAWNRPWRGRPGSDLLCRPFFRPHVRAVDHDPADVDQSGGVGAGKCGLMDLLERPGLPVSQPAPTRHPGTEPEFLGQVFPPDPGDPHKQDSRTTRRESICAGPGA